MEDLGDPTDAVDGWNVVFKRLKTGPQVFNVEYQLSVLKCKIVALTDEQNTLIGELKSMDDVLPRPTADAQLELLRRVTSDESDTPDDVDAEFDVS